ncbi:MAG TPA: hypothetical protein VGQ69_12250, partial [Gemmatimonadales bacterium]|nr:hypothetical protein [Gemmatimonadales bacterium]
MLLLHKHLLNRLGGSPTIAVSETALLGAWFGALGGLIDGVMPFVWVALTGDPRDARSPLGLWMAPLGGALVGAGFGALLGLGLRIWRVGLLTIAVAIFAAFTLDSALLSLKLPVHHLALFLLSAGLAVQLAQFAARRPAGFQKLVRRTLPLLAGWVVAVGAGEWVWSRWRERLALAELPAAPAGAPNVLLLILDTVRASELSLYGYPRATSPELERWAAG